MGSFNKTVLKDSKGSEVLGFAFGQEILVVNVCFVYIQVQGEML
jgi:hypothetical protein